ncbi:MAG: hypothetical protein NHG36_18015 [Chromatiaceae bacterium]|nr:hypothetical protein [Candidatus Thioaporhodococcus sediminis]
MDLIRVADLDFDYGLLGLVEGLLVILRDRDTGGDSTNHKRDSSDST